MSPELSILAQQLERVHDVLRQLVANTGDRLTREDMLKRLKLKSRTTLSTYIKQGRIPRPGKDGKWLLSEVMESEKKKLGD